MPTCPRVLLWFGLVCTTPVAAQTEWTRTPRVHAGAGQAVVYDAVRSRVLMYGGASGAVTSDTWEWDGAVWTHLPSTDNPPRRSQFGLAWDSRRQRLVLFGGENETGGVFDDTWEWDGARWTRVLPTTTPPARAGHAMTYDAQRGVVVLFGGHVPFLGSTSAQFGDTWEWDGVRWTERATTVAPSARSDAAMAYDPVRGRTVLFGGGPLRGAGTDETWEWDGTAWEQRSSSAAQPTELRGGAMAFDAARNRITMFGGTRRSGAQTAELWEWDGTSWSVTVPASRPSNRTGAGLAFDAGRGCLVLFGSEWSSDTWEWDGARWTQVTPGSPAFTNAPLAYDSVRGRTVALAAGLNAGTWEWDGTRWERTGNSPPGSEPKLVFDAERGRMLLFEGSDGSTWSWDGSAWQQVATAGPGPRFGAALAWDEGRDVVLLFGGSLGSLLGDTWAWDGSAWSQLQPATAPRARERAAMVYDARRDRIVLSGGSTRAPGPPGPGDTWEWDGQTWQERLSSTAPFVPRLDAAMTYDVARERVVLHGGQVASGLLWSNDTWEWDGAEWWSVTTPVTPPRRFVLGRSALVYDSRAARSVLFAGVGRRLEIWDYGAVDPASYATFGSGCAGTAGVPALTATGLPWLGATMTMRVDNLPAVQPAAWVLGVSASQWGPVMLPAPLGTIGMPGCLLLLAPVVTVPLSVLGSTRRWSLRLPGDPRLVGLSYYEQVFALDPGANPAGAVVSNGGAGVVGAR